MKRFSDKLSFANIVSCLALFVALGGVGYAATQLPKKSVGTKQIKNGAVTAAKVKTGSLLARNFAAGQLPKGEVGPRGETGKQGEKGEAGNANVIYSGWAPATESADEVYDGTWDAIETISAPSLTSARLEDSSVEVYAKFEENNILPLPYVSMAGGTFNTLSYTLSKEKITLRRATDGCNEESCVIGFGGLEYRYVITPGSAKAT